MAFLLFLGAYHLIRFSDKKFHLIFCNVGQGDGILMRTPNGIDIIIDGGPLENSMTECLTRHIPFWDRTIEAVFLTHPDADHLTGILGVVKSYNVSFFGMSDAPKTTGAYEELVSILREKKIKTQMLFRNDILRTKDGFVLTTDWPTKEFLNLKSQDTNEYSLVQQVTFGKFKILLTGDIPSTYLNSIMPTLDRLDVFKPPHHGSKTGTDEFTFQHLKPQIAAISVGLHNRYGHPSDEVLNIFKRLKIPFKRTDQAGDIEIVSDGVKWWLR